MLRDDPSSPEIVYLCGHSLGLQPKSVRKYVEDELLAWQTLAVDGVQLCMEFSNLG